MNLSFLDAIVATDEHGFRRPVPERGARTALVVGDPSAFGWLLEGRDTFAARLQADLDRAAGREAWRVLNAGTETDLRLRVMS